MPGEIDFQGFDYDAACYGTVANADEYFSHKPQGLDDWSGMPSEEKQKALLEATVAIDRLMYAGDKTAVYLLKQSDAAPSNAQLAAADASQPLKFPRNGEDEVPEDIVKAAYEEAQSILSGRNSQLEIENLSITSDGAGSTRYSFDRSHKPARHLAAGITSMFAFAYLMPFLADVSTFDTRRV